MHARCTHTSTLLAPELNKQALSWLHPPPPSNSPIRVHKIHALVIHAPEKRGGGLLRHVVPSNVWDRQLQGSLVKQVDVSWDHAQALAAAALFTAIKQQLQTQADAQEGLA